MKPTHEQICDSAYKLFCQREGSAGSPEEDWLQAEHQLSSGAVEVLTAPEHNASAAPAHHLSHHDRNRH